MNPEQEKAPKEEYCTHPENYGNVCCLPRCPRFYWAIDYSIEGLSCHFRRVNKPKVKNKKRNNKS